MQGKRSVLMVEEGGIGGVADYTDELATALAIGGWEVHLATGCDHSGAAPHGVHVHKLFPYVRGRSAAGRIVRAAGLSRPVNGATHLAATLPLAMLARGCDIAHLQGEEWRPLCAARAVAIRAAGLPVVYTPHNTFTRDAEEHRWADALIDSCASAVIVHSDYDLSRLGARRRRMACVIPHGDYAGLARRSGTAADRSAARLSLGIDDDEIAVLLFGQLRPDKGVRDLLEAARRTTRVKIVLAGEEAGGLAECADLLDDRTLNDRVVVREGFVASTDVGTMFAASDVVALPYRRASASGVLMLAYAYQRAVVAYPVGGLPEYVVDGETGWMCDAADPSALARQMEVIVAGGHAECQRRGRRAARLMGEQFAWDSIAKRTLAVYESAIAMPEATCAP